MDLLNGFLTWCNSMVLPHIRDTRPNKSNNGKGQFFLQVLRKDSKILKEVSKRNGGHLKYKQLRCLG